MGVKLVSSSNGSVEIVAPVTATNYTATMPAGTGTVSVIGVNSAITSGTAVASTSGTSIDFTSIPSWVKRITVMFNGVSTNGTSYMQIQIGTSGGVQTTGYLSSFGYVGSTTGIANATTGFGLYNDAAADLRSGSLTLNLLDLANGVWTCSGVMGWSNRQFSLPTSGAKTLSGTLDRVRITTVNGTDTFDAGSINILYE
jgi:hypothetical protein